MLQYQTNGYQLNVKLQSLTELHPYSFNTERLSAKGYDIARPKKKVDITVDKGLYKMSQKINDFKADKTMNKDNIMLHAIDPGRSDVVSTCDVLLQDCSDSKSTYENGNFWSIRR